MRERQEEAKRVEELRLVGGTERSERPIPPRRWAAAGFALGRQRWACHPPAAAARQGDTNSKRLRLSLIVLPPSHRREIKIQRYTAVKIFSANSKRLRIALIVIPHSHRR